MRILVAGDWHSELHEEVVQAALVRLGHEVSAFKWHGYFRARPGGAGKVWHLAQRFQNKFVAGPLIRRINRDFLAAVRRTQPESIFIYRGTHLTGDTLQTVRKMLPQAILVGYNNDDPFAPSQPRYLWRHFLHAVPSYDLVLAYRHANLDEYRRIGAKRVELLRSWFVPERNHPVELNDGDRERFECDVVFVGHYEPDQRLGYLEAIARRGFRLRIFGPGYDWDPVLERSSALSSQRPVRLVWGEDYNRALCGAKVALCFLSKLNRDTYTRRCFEIPATGTVLLSEFSEDLASLYREGVEAEYFRDERQLIEKLERLVGDESLRRSIASAGALRVRRDGHDVVSRMELLITRIQRLQAMTNIE